MTTFYAGAIRHRPVTPHRLGTEIYGGSYGNKPNYKGGFHDFSACRHADPGARSGGTWGMGEGKHPRREEILAWSSRPCECPIRNSSARQGGRYRRILRAVTVAALPILVT